MKKQLFTILLLSSVLFAETQLGKDVLSELKKLKPLNNKDVVITEGVEKDGLYVLRLKVKDVRGTKIVPASVTENKKYVLEMRTTEASFMSLLTLIVLSVKHLRSS